MSENLTPDGYYCDHSDEPWDARTHHGWEWVEEEGQVFTHQPNTLSAHIGFQEYLKPEDRERRCPRAEAVYGHSQVAPLLAEIDRLRAELAERPDEEYPGELAHLRDLLRALGRAADRQPKGNPLTELLIDHYSDSRIVDAELAKQGGDL